MTLNKKTPKLFWCNNCLNNSLRPRITFDDRGWCNAINMLRNKLKQNVNKIYIDV